MSSARPARYVEPYEEDQNVPVGEHRAAVFSMRQPVITAVLMTLVTTALLGIAYPLVVTLLAQVLFPHEANGQLIERGGRIVGSRIIGQSFSSPQYFHGRPSAAGSGYDGANSGATNLGPTNRKLVDAVGSAVDEAHRDNPGRPVPVDLVTSSASGLDPHISPAAALFQVPRIARARGVNDGEIRQLVESRIEPRQLGFLGEPRVNVLELNLALDDRFPMPRALRSASHRRAGAVG